MTAASLIGPDTAGPRFPFGEMLAGFLLLASGTFGMGWAAAILRSF